jgi:hypothetical protein
MVAAWIDSAYWLSPTAFGNPAITIALANQYFAGIRPADAPAFIGAQCAGARVIRRYKQSSTDVASSRVSPLTGMPGWMWRQARLK